MLFWAFMLLLAGFYYYFYVYLRRERISNICKKCVFVTGCDSGFGHALAQRLDSLGVTVFAGCLTEKGASDLKLRTSNKLCTVIVDIAKTESITQAYEYVKANIPRGNEFWAVVNNAGMGGPGGPIEFMTRKDWLDLFQINMFGPVDVINSFLPLLKASRGRIVNMASITGLLALTMNHPYVAGKFAMVGFSDALRREKKAWGITVSVLLAGGFRTAIFNFEPWKKMKEEQWRGLPKEIQEEFGEQFLDQVMAQRRHMTTNMTKPDFSPVVDAYEHALFSKRPREHYCCGWDAQLYSLVSQLPPSVSDFFVRILMKMPLPQTLQKK